MIDKYRLPQNEIYTIVGIAIYKDYFAIRTYNEVLDTCTYNGTSQEHL